MHWYNYLALAAWSVGAVGLLCQRRWLLAAGWACMASYLVFGKWMPGVLPELVPDMLSLAGLCLIVQDIVRTRRRKATAETTAG